MKLEEILADRPREKRQVYVIETDRNLYLVKGHYITIANPSIQDIYYLHFLKGKPNDPWGFLLKRIKWAESNEEWTHFDNFDKETDFKIEAVWSDGEKNF